MGHVGVLEPEAHRPDESLVFWRLSREVFADEADLVDSAFPALAFALARADDLEHLGLGHRLHLLNRHGPLARLLLALLLDHVGEHLRVPLLLPVHEVSGHCALLDVLDSALGVLLLVLLDGLLHLYLLLEALLIEELGLEALQGLRLLGDDLGLPCVLLPALLLGIESLSESLLVKIHVVVLRHAWGLLSRC